MMRVNRYNQRSQRSCNKLSEEMRLAETVTGTGTVNVALLQKT